MTPKKLIKRLKELFVDDDYFFTESELDNTDEFGEAPIVAETGGFEGGGDYAMKVRHFKKFDTYIRQTGFYSSYNGTDWEDDFKEVKPVQKMVTVFE
jgi:hypothetical protein